MEHYLVNFVGDLFSLLIIFQYLSAVSEKIDYPKIVRTGVTLLGFGIIFIGSNFVFSQSTIIVLFMLGAFLLLNLLYKSKWYIKLLHSVILYVIMVIPEIFVVMTIQFLDIDVATIQDNIYIYTISNFTSRLISFFIVRTVKLFVKKSYIIEPKSVVFLVPLPIATIFMMVLFLRTCFIVDDTYYQVLTLVSSVVLVFANLSIFFFIDRMNDYTENKTDLMLYEREYKSQKLYLDSLQEHLSETRAFRHDTKNNMLALIGLMNAGEHEKALTEMKRSLNILDESGSDIVNTNHPIIDALLQNKLRENKPKGIFVRPIIKLTDELLVNEVDMGILLGNIVDNAIEATDRLEKEKRIPIEVRILSLDGIVSINVQNAVDHEVDTESLHTIKKDKLMHGHGVKQIKKTVARYDGTAEFSCKNNVFTVKTTMVNRPRR